MDRFWHTVVILTNFGFQEDEMRLLCNVLACVRSGQVSLAQELCVRAGHHWRAASLEGWKLHHDPNPKDPSQRQPIIGNPYRWVVCRQTGSTGNGEGVQKEKFEFLVLRNVYLFYGSFHIL